MDRPVTLITGARKGIGRHLVEYFLERGHRVYGCSRGPAEFTHTNYTHVPCSVEDEAAAKALLKRIRIECGRLDNLINNAGTASMNQALLVPVSTVHRVFDTNFLGTFLFCREGAKLMQKRKYGRIVNFVTVAVPLRLEGEAVYGASKAAILNFTQVLAKELAPFGITVNAVGPNVIETDLVRGVPQEKLQKLLQKQAIPRYGKPKDVANVVEFLLRPESELVTGQCVYLGGVA